MMESVTLDWRCKRCGNVRRVDVTDISASVFRYKPPGWAFESGAGLCDRCIPQSQPGVLGGPPTTRVSDDDAQWAHGPAPSAQGDAMRNQLSGLRAGHGGEGQQDTYGIRQPPNGMQPGQPGPPRVTVADADGKQTSIELQGIEPIKTAPARTLPGTSGMSSDSMPSYLVGGQASAMGKKEARFGNVVFEDTRQGEFVGPTKVVAGVPSMTERCIGCGFIIQDGTTGSGGSEQWRTARDSTFERGHNACLDKIGR